MAPGPGEAASRPPPVADNYLKGEGGEGERGRKIQRRNGTKREGTKAWRSGGKWNRGGEGGRKGPEGKTRSFVTGSEEPEGAPEHHGEIGSSL